MAQIFHPSTNTISKVSILIAVLFLLGMGWIVTAINRSPYVTQAGVARAQPVQFSHKHHVGDAGSFAGYPAEPESEVGNHPEWEFGEVSSQPHSQSWGGNRQS
jgi:hypothetical protein